MFTCLFNSSNLPLVVATVKDPFCLSPVDKPVSFSSSLYKFNEWFLNLVIVADEPICPISPAGCQVVPEVN